MSTLGSFFFLPLPFFGSDASASGASVASSCASIAAAAAFSARSFFRRLLDFSFAQS